MRDFQKKRQWVCVIIMLPILIFASARCSRDQKNQSPPQQNNQDTKRVETKQIKPDRIKPESAGVTVPVPDWAADAIWYSIEIDRFHNGDKTNDPEGTEAWTSDWLLQFKDRLNLKVRIYGGDLQGLKQRFSYLKTLGVNTLLLSPVFQGTSIHPEKNILHHIDDRYGKRKSATNTKQETHDPATWGFTESDRIFIDFIKEAHRMGFRIVAGMNFIVTDSEQDNISFERQQSILAATRRWMDPNDDGDPSDGVDGWQIHHMMYQNKSFEEVWKKYIVNLNKEVLLIGYGCSMKLRGARNPFVNNELNNSAHLELKDTITVLLKSLHNNEQLVPLRSISQPIPQQLFRQNIKRTDFRFRTLYPPDKLEKLYNQWRLAVIFQYFSYRAVLTYYGNEVGTLPGSGLDASLPMWWPDLPDPKTKSPSYRGDFFALIQWLNETRTKYAPLRRGDLREVMLDEANHILAFARTYQNEEVILVMNFSSTKQKVMLPAGKPGQIVVTLSPHLTQRPVRGEKKIDYTKIRRLSVGAARQFVNKEGKIRMWLDPMSVRVVLISDK